MPRGGGSSKEARKIVRKKAQMKARKIEDGNIARKQERKGSKQAIKQTQEMKEAIKQESTKTNI